MTTGVTDHRSDGRPYGDVPLLTGVAAHGITGSVAELPDQPLPTEEWRHLLAGARLQRLTGLLVRAIDDGALAATADQADEATELHLHAMTVALRLELRLIEVAERLAGAELPFRVLKGIASSHLDYDDPTLRSFHDVDILVPADRLDEAVRVLEEGEFRRRFPAPRPGFDARFGKSVTLEAPDGAELDLHRTFALGPFGQRIAAEDLWSGPGTPFALAGVPLVALDPDLRLLHASYHAILGDSPPRLVPLRDVAELALGPDVSVRRVLERVTAWGGEAVLARAVRTAWGCLRIADITTLSTWALQHQDRARDERDLACYVRADASFAGKAYAAVRGIPRPVDRLAYLRALLLPQRSYLDGRHRSRLSRLRQGTAAVLRRDEPG